MKGQRKAKRFSLDFKPDFFYRELNQGNDKRLSEISLPQVNFKRKRDESQILKQKRRLSDDFSLSNAKKNNYDGKTQKPKKKIVSENFESLIKKCNDFKFDPRRKSINLIHLQNTSNVKKIRKSIRISEFPDFWFGNEFNNPGLVKDAQLLGNELNIEMSEITSNHKWRVSSRETLKRAEQVIEDLESHFSENKKS
jgi:hypothetical protein